MFRALKRWLAEQRRYSKGGEPVPGALEHTIEFVSARPSLEIDSWIEQDGVAGISPDIARFVFEFFDARGVPMGKVRPEDRLQADLNLNEALAQEWGDEFQEEFMDGFGVSRLFRPGPAPDTVGEVLSFVQQELDDWQADAAKE